MWPLKKKDLQRLCELVDFDARVDKIELIQMTDYLNGLNVVDYYY